MSSALQNFVDAANAFDVEGILKLFADDGFIDDTSVGHVFRGLDGVRRYAEEYFVGYETRSRILTVEVIDAHRSTARVDFTGNFGHEIGLFEIVTNEAGLIVSVKTYLE
jgi:hypothetical protein